MADTWLLPDKKKDLLSYIEEGASEEDLYAAGFNKDNLFEVGWFTQPEFEPVEPKGAIEPYTPTLREDYTLGTANTLSGFGLDPKLARDVAERVWGRVGSQKDSYGLGLADLTPMAAPFGIQEGFRTAKKGVASGDPLTVGMGGLEAGLGVLEALPLGKPVVKGVKKVADRLIDQYDPSQVNMFLGTSAKEAALSEKELAEFMINAGRNPKLVRMTTGWFQDPVEKNWHFEISDEALKLDAAIVDTLQRQPLRRITDVPLKDYVSHKELFDNYPEIADYDLDLLGDSAADHILGKNLYGGFSPFNKKVYIRVGKDSGTTRRTLAHELQHAVDKLEGRDAGASPQKVYHDIAAELENMPEIAKQYVEQKTMLKNIDASAEAGDFSFSGLKHEIARTLPSYKKILGNSYIQSLDDLIETAKLDDPEIFDWFDIYQRNLGEEKARATEGRLDLPPSERFTDLPLSELSDKENWTSRQMKRLLNELSEERLRYGEESYLRGE